MINDANIHCEFEPGEDLDIKQTKIDTVISDMDLNGVEKGFLYFTKNHDFEDGNYALDFKNRIIPAACINIKEGNYEQKLDLVCGAGVKAIKIHPYHQQLLYEDFDYVAEYCNEIQKRGMILTIDGSYGSERIYDTNGVELAIYVLNKGFKNPLIIAHGGMVKQLDMFTMMDVYSNIYFDISFTIKFWWESHIIDDLYFIMKKLNFEHCFYGSDYPYVSMEESMKYFDMFCEKYHISVEDRRKLLYDNFDSFCKGYLEGKS